MKNSLKAILRSLETKTHNFTVIMFVADLLRNDLTIRFKIFYVYSVSLRNGYKLFFMTLGYY